MFFRTMAFGSKQHPPPHLKREKATAKLLRKVIDNGRLPLCVDIVFHPNPCLPSRRPICLNQPVEDMAAIGVWCVEWSATDVVDHSLVAVPSVWSRSSVERVGNVESFQIWTGMLCS